MDVKWITEIGKASQISEFKSKVSASKIAWNFHPFVLHQNYRSHGLILRAHILVMSHQWWHTLTRLFHNWTYFFDESAERPLSSKPKMTHQPRCCNSYLHYVHIAIFAFKINKWHFIDNTNRHQFPNEDIRQRCDNCRWFKLQLKVSKRNCAIKIACMQMSNKYFYCFAIISWIFWQNADRKYSFCGLNSFWLNWNLKSFN